MIAFHLPGGLPVYVYSLLLVLSAVTGLAWVALRTPEDEVSLTMDAGLLVLAGGLIGGRIVYVVIHWQYFKAHLWEIVEMYLGGFSWVGALAGGIIVLVFYAIVVDESVGILADRLFPLGVLLVFSSWLACWIEGCAYGSTMDVFWMLPARDEWGRIAPRLPVQLIGALLALVVLWLLDWRKEKMRIPGYYASLGLLILSLITLGLSLVRSDPAPEWYGLRLDVWAALGFAGLGILMLGILITKSRKYVEISE